MNIEELTRQLAAGRGSGGGLSGRVRSDSRKVERGDVFVAVQGTKVDGHVYVEEVARLGAGAIVVERAVGVKGVREVVVPDSVGALAELAQASCGYPRDVLTVLGVTGTKGKTTTTYLVRWILNQSQIGCGMIGTVAYDVGGGKVLPSNNTTPDSLQLAEMMGQMRDAGLKAMAMECSSHGLDQRRTAGLKFRAAAFTNLTGDHLDYHGDRAHYLEAKSRLFRELGEGAVAILNRYDAASEYLAGVTKAKVMWYSAEGTEAQRHKVTKGEEKYGMRNAECRSEEKERNEIVGRIRKIDLSGTEFELEGFGGRAVVKTRLAGEFNVSNCLAAAGLAYAAGASFDQIAAGIASFPGVPGRLERVEAGQDFTVLVDYAHTDDALTQTLSMLRGLEPRRVMVVFGCGGDRDRTKRPRMAAAAEQLADVVVVTSDNPRTEDPKQIFDDIRKGFTEEIEGTKAQRRKGTEGEEKCRSEEEEKRKIQGGGASSHGAERAVEIVEIRDRAEAIGWAMNEAGAGDVVLIAGKGHEDYQILGVTKIHFDDREVAKEKLKIKMQK